ncbi:MAG: nicotinate (nicotinamide) nucleotide adenylyltransferase [Rhodoferax sp.]|nr:nicotinate (nicotinamide) nucleotide adenylyltransferase [Rhodoferax sp.]
MGLLPRRIGIFGGAFDPPHRAHRALLEAALTELKLDALHVVPTGQAWHKPHQLSAPAHRLAMLQLALAELPQIVVDTQEMDRTGPSYTIDTLRRITVCVPGADLFLIMGADQAAALTTWRAWQEIVQLATICVADRADLASATGVFDAEKMFPQRFFHLTMAPLRLSATRIRSLISHGQSVQTLVSEPVARYIAAHHLYQTV